MNGAWIAPFFFSALSQDWVFLRAFEVSILETGLKAELWDLASLGRRAKFEVRGAGEYAVDDVFIWSFFF